MKKILFVVIGVVLLLVGIAFAADPAPDSSAYWQTQIDFLKVTYNATLLELRAVTAEKSNIELLFKEYSDKLKAAKEREEKEAKKEVKKEKK
jgi:hypothetical protein